MMVPSLISSRKVSSFVTSERSVRKKKRVLVVLCMVLVIGRFGTAACLLCTTIRRNILLIWLTSCETLLI